MSGCWQMAILSEKQPGCGGVSRMHKQKFETQPRDWPTTSEEVWRFDKKSPRHGKTLNCSEWSERTTSYRLFVCECRWSADLGGGFQFEPFRDGSWPPDIGLGVQPDVLGSFWSKGDAAVSGGGSTECGTSDNGDTVSSVMSPGSPYTTVTVGSRCAVGKGRGWLMAASSLVMEIVACQSWYGVQSTMGGGVSWSWWMEPWTSIGTSRSWGIKCCHGRRGCLDVTLCSSKTIPCPIHHVTRQPFWTIRMLRSCTGQLGVQIWTPLSMFGIKCQSGSDTWMTPPPPPPPLFFFGAKCELGGCALFAWLHTLPAYCH